MHTRTKRKALGVGGVVAVVVAAVLALGTLAAGAWVHPIAKGDGVTCTAEWERAGQAKVTLTNLEVGNYGSPGHPKVMSVFPNYTYTEFTPDTLANTGDQSATMTVDIPADESGVLKVNWEMNWYGTSGTDSASGKTEIPFEKCDKPTTTTTEPETSTTTSTLVTTTTLVTTDIEAKALCDHQIDDSEWHFVITQTNDVQAPALIHVKWENGQEADVPLDKVTGGVAHYVTTLNLNSDVASATATIAGEWSGQFNLSHGPDCELPVTTTTTSTTQPSTTTTSTTSTSTTSTTAPSTTTTSTTEPTTSTTSTTSTTQPSTTTSTTEPSTTTTSSTQVTSTTATSSTIPSTTVPSSKVTTTTVCESNESTASTIGTSTSNGCAKVALIPPVSIERSGSLPVTGAQMVGWMMIIAGLLGAGGLAAILASRKLAATQH